jgi:hypothetical protein
MLQAVSIRGFPSKLLMNFSFPSCDLHVPSIVFALIMLTKYLQIRYLRINISIIYAL